MSPRKLPPFGAVPVWVMDRMRGNHAVIVLYAVLSALADRTKDGGWRLSQEELADKPGTSVRSVQRAVKALTDAGCLRVEHQPYGGQNGWSRYFPVTHEPPDHTTPVAGPPSTASTAPSNQGVTIDPGEGEPHDTSGVARYDTSGVAVREPLSENPSTDNRARSQANRASDAGGWRTSWGDLLASRLLHRVGVALEEPSRSGLARCLKAIELQEGVGEACDLFEAVVADVEMTGCRPTEAMSGQLADLFDCYGKDEAEMRSEVHADLWAPPEAVERFGRRS